jgi:hypothetical protein
MLTVLYNRCGCHVQAMLYVLTTCTAHAVHAQQPAPHPHYTMHHAHLSHLSQKLAAACHAPICITQTRIEFTAAPTHSEELQRQHTLKSFSQSNPHKVAKLLVRLVAFHLLL